MMKESLVFPEILPKDKPGALREMVRGIAKEFPALREDELFSVIMDRERLSSTGIGSGIAIPHAKPPHCKEHIAAFGRSRAGIDFEAIDGKPVHMIFMIIGPLGANEAHLRALARISKFLHDANFRDRLLTSNDAMDIYEAIAEKDAQY